MATNIFNMADMWANGTQLFHAIKMSVTNTASAIGSKLLQLEANGVSQFSVGPDGATLVGVPAGGVMGAGTVNAKGYYIDGVIVTAGGGSGNVIVSGTPVNGQLARWTDAFHIEGFTASYQPLDADLTALAALTGTNDIYYRSGANVWSPVTMGSNMSFSGGILTSTTTPVTAEYITAAIEPALLNERVLTNTATITWDFSTAGQAKANVIGGGGGGAPVDAEYITSAAHAGLGAERLLTNTASVTWDFATAGQAKANVIPAITIAPTPVDNQLAVWTGAAAVEGDAKLTWNGANLRVGDIASQNTIQITPAGAGANPGLAAVGVDTNINFVYATKGTGQYQFYTGSFARLQFAINDQSVGTAYLAASGGNVTNLFMSDGAPVKVKADLLADSIAVTQLAADNSTKVATTAFVKAQPSPSKLGFSVRRATDQTSISDATWTKVIFNTSEFNDAGSGYDNSVNLRWVPPAGKVQMQASVYASGTLPGTPLFISIYKNGVIFRQVAGASVSSIQASSMINIIDLANGTDFYEVYVLGYTSTSIALYGTAPHGTFFMGSTL